jgi:NitT/TauT family transport system substrate-binding protein
LKKRTNLVVVLIGVALVILAGVYTLTLWTKPPPAQVETVKIGVLRGSVGSILWISNVKGFFKEEAIDAKFFYFDAAGPITTALAAGDIDAGSTGIVAATYTTIAEGSKTWLVADSAQMQPGYPGFGNALLVRADLYDAGVRTLKDLKGKKIGITTVGSTYHYMLGRALEKENMTMTDVQLIFLRERGIILGALKEKTVDAIVMSAPYHLIPETDGYGRVILWFGDALGGYQVCALMYGNRLIENKDLGLRFMRAYLKGLRYQYDAVFQKKNYDEVLTIVSDFGNIPKKDLEAGGFFNLDPNGRLLVDDLSAQQEWYLKNGFIKQIVPTQHLVDPWFVEQAVKQLGEHKTA